MNIVLAVAAALLVPGSGASRLQAKVDEMCPDLKSECGLVDAADCAFEEPPAQRRPARAEMSQEEFREHRSQAVARRELMLACICCDHVSVDDVAALRSQDDGSGDGSPDDGSGFGHRHHHVHGFGHLVGHLVGHVFGHHHDGHHDGHRHHHGHGHGFGFGHHHQGHGNEDLQARFDELMCPDDLRSECDGPVDDRDCAFEEAARPDRAAMTEEQKDARRSEARARRERMLKCLCCDGPSVDDDAAALRAGHPGHGFGGRGRGKGAEGRGFEGRGGRSAGRWKGFKGRGERSGGRGFEGHHKGGRGFRGEGRSGGRWKGFKGKGRGERSGGRGFEGHHKGGREGGRGFRGHGPPSPEKIQAELDEECPAFDCDGEDVEGLKADCTWFDAVMAGEDPRARRFERDGDREGPGERHRTRGGRGGDRWEHWKNKRLSCGCCRGE